MTKVSNTSFMISRIYSISIALIFLALFLLAFTTAARAEEPTDNTRQTPVWTTISPSGHKTAMESELSASPANEQAQEKLAVTIQAETLQVQKGESISFELKSNQPKVRYFWSSGSQKGSDSLFAIDTAGLEAGKHRVIATVTNANREQAHASIFFNVTVITTAQDNAAPESPTTVPGGNILELPAPDQTGSKMVKMPGLLGLRFSTVLQTLEASGLQASEITYQINDDAVDVIIGQKPPAGITVSVGANVELVVGKAGRGLSTLRILPDRATVEKGEQIEFTADVDAEGDANQLKFEWSFNGQKHSGRSFIINTKTLTSGQHVVSLQVIDSLDRKLQAEALLNVSEDTLLVPDLTGKTSEQARVILANSGLKLGQITRVEADVDQESITAQTPAANENSTEAAAINITLQIPKSSEDIFIGLSSDTDSVKAGDSVTFYTGLDPEQKGKDIHYIYTINDEKIANIAPSFEWMPEEEGIYTINVAAFSDEGMLARSDPLTVEVAPAWEKPVARIVPEMQLVEQGSRIEFTSTSTYDLNSTLEYDWTSETQHSGAKKHFSFDTADLEPGFYTVKLNVTDNQGNTSEAEAKFEVQTIAAENSLTLQSNQGNIAAAVEDTKQPFAPEIKLSANRKIVSANTPLRIKANSPASLAAAYYYFELGDGARAEWQVENEVEHNYQDFGAYTVRAAVKQGDEVYYSGKMTIWVWSPLLLFLTAGLAALFFYLLFWWKTKYSRSRMQSSIASESLQPLHTGTPAGIQEEQIPLNDHAYGHSVENTGDDGDIVTGQRSGKNETVKMVLLRGLAQFILGLLISAVIIYILLKFMGLY